MILSWVLTSTVSDEFRREVLLVFTVEIFKIVVVLNFFQDILDYIVRNSSFSNGLGMTNKDLEKGYSLLLTELFPKLVILESLIRETLGECLILSYELDGSFQTFLELILRK